MGSFSLVHIRWVSCSPEKTIFRIGGFLAVYAVSEFDPPLKFNACFELVLPVGVWVLPVRWVVDLFSE